MTYKKNFNWVVNGHQIVSIEDIFWLFPPTDVWLFASKLSTDLEMQDKHRARWAARNDDGGVEYVEILYDDGEDNCVYAWCGMPGIHRKDEMHVRTLTELLLVVVEWHKRNRNLKIQSGFVDCEFIDERKDASIL